MHSTTASNSATGSLLRLSGAPNSSPPLQRPAWNEQRQLTYVTQCRTGEASGLATRGARTPKTAAKILCAAVQAAPSAGEEQAGQRQLSPLHGPRVLRCRHEAAQQVPHTGWRRQRQAGPGGGCAVKPVRGMLSSEVMLLCLGRLRRCEGQTTTA